MIRPALVVLAAIACLLWPTPARAQGAENPLGDCRVFGEVTYRGRSEINSTDHTGLYLVDVRIVCDDATLYADEVRWTAERVTATGNVLLQQPGLHVLAERIELDRVTRFGTFHHAVGWARVAGSTKADRGAFGAFESDLEFSAEKVERIGPRTYRLTRGWYSACAQPVPRWVITMTSGTVVLDERLTARNAVLRVKKIPVFYAPIIYYPLGSDERSTGFLMPSYATSGTHGSTVSNAFFLVLGRSQDVTLFHNWFAKTGQGVGAEYRFVSGPGSDGTAQFTMLDEREIGRRTYRVTGSANQRLSNRFHVIGRADYMSNLETQQLYQQNLFDLSRRDRYFGATLAGSVGRYRITARAEQRDYFSGLTFAQRQGRAPSVQVTVGERPIGRSRVYVGATTEAAHFIRQDDISRPETDHSLWRFDTAPTIRAPLSRLLFLSLSTSATWRLTHWSESQATAIDGTLTTGPLTRNLVDLRADLVGPVFAKIWTPSENGYADRFKHVIAPRVSVSWLSAFEQFGDVVQVDWIDQLVGGTTTVTYGLVNSLLARRKQAAGRGAMPEILAVSVSQSYYSNALAAAYDPQYQFTTSSTFSPIQITTTAAPGEGFHARFQMAIDPNVYKPQSYAASATVGPERTQLAAGWSKRAYLPGVPGFDTPESASHFINFGVTARSADGRVAGTYAANYDLGHRSLLQQRVVLHLNAQCCGVSLDYQTLRQGVSGTTVLPADRRFGISFSLAGLATFSNPFGSFGDNSGRR